MVDEDKYSTYSSLILKYYLAEAITNKHKVFLASANQPPTQIIQVGLHLHVYMGFRYVVNNQHQVNADPDAKEKLFPRILTQPTSSYVTYILEVLL